MYQLLSTLARQSGNALDQGTLIQNTVAVDE